ncbi:MAG: chromosome segregation protein SMC [Pseudomonadota bacterium]|nr:MAG: chromosome segregation protein SMC [Pseudomonadota bacterium]
MRLTAIKLSGFKSFVEPTTIRFPSNLMGIVGPNGCGKSNIIDAVRWVMGESSARQLRGESMSDVIFSGSSARKPVATATVELVFDNSDGRAGGEYADYAEISVKRQVSRDGQSAYYLNGTRCRRKDITRLFLGTGLGPRSYAIIEQGMISQIVEARPEELRAFLEEAAGISKYKERRRETENRIRHTRENLERLSDLREEVGKHLDKLKRQANAAERYRKLQKRYRQDEARLLALRWRELSARADQERAELHEVETRLEARLSDQRSAEKELEALRERQHKARDVVAGVQGELYEVAGQIARIEQEIEHQREIRRRQQTEYEDTETQLNELKQHLVLDQAQVKDTSEELARLTPELEQARQAEREAQAAVERIDAETEDWQQRWQRHHSEAGEVSSQAELLRQRIEHLDERMSRAAERIRTLEDDGGEAPHGELVSEQAGLEQKLKEADERLAELRAAVDERQQAMAELGTRIEEQRDALEQLRAQRHERHARRESLRLLNQDRDHHGVREAWFKRQGLDQRARLLERIDINDPRWNRAVESVLGRWLRAATVDRLQSHLGDEMPEAGLMLVEDGAQAADDSETLAALVQGAGALTPVLARVVCVDDVESGQRRLAELPQGHSVITPDGLWMGHGWLRQPPAEQGDSGVLEREQSIRELAESIAEDDGQIAAIEQRLAEMRSRREHTDGELGDARAALESTQAERARIHASLAGVKSRLDSLRRQREAAREELQRLRQRQDEDGQGVSQTRAELEQVLERMRTFEAAREPLREQKRELDSQRQQARSALLEARERRESLSLKVGSGRAGLESLRQSISRMDSQVGQLQSRYLELSEALAQGDEPVAAQQRKRDGFLEQRLAIEARLREVRGDLEQLENAWREQDEIRQQAAAEVDHIRQDQSERQLALKETQLKAQSLAERIEGLDADLEALLGEMPEGVEAAQYQQELEALETKIRRLEPVNLAAIDEFRTESERKEYLDRQQADLEEALDTLEQAISRIDRDTRTRFRETFEQVNKNMETLFPRLFGGGHGHLEMVGDDWLSAGVAIMARPPGKRIARIHLLSGGEKALTAVAFVFAIFNLNPAPFCLLDEVDAPLDDANVGRFSDMVREMSEQVQFVIVTHNKVTMEVTYQMLGVTMREPGVSRLVSVDLDRAVALAES